MHFILPFYIKEKIINNYKNEIQKTNWTINLLIAHIQMIPFNWENKSVKNVMYYLPF